MYLEKAQSNLENNKGQTFINEVTLTKHLKGQLQQSDMLQKNCMIFGCPYKRKELWALAALISLFLINFLGVIILWWTSTLDNYVLSHMILVNNTAAFSLWKDPPVKALINVHIFNYTNVDEYVKGLADRLHVEDVGPFVYEETSRKINVKIHPNSSISYQEFHTHTYREDLSQSRKETDRLIVPNLSVLGAAAVSQNWYFIPRSSVSNIMRTLQVDMFLNLAANRFLWGYDDNLYALAKALLTFHIKLPYEKIGILAARNGTSEDTITIHSGVNDFNKIAQIERVNGRDHMDCWDSEECNKIKGSDGSAFPIYDVRQKKPVEMYFRQICRRIPFVFKENVRVLNDLVDAHRYTMADSIFERAEVEPANQCYCDGPGMCSPRGIINISKCAFRAPASISLPHFYKADPAIQTNISGLNPNSKDHSSFIDLHPTLGFPVGGVYRLQVNMQVKKAYGMLQTDMFRQDDLYLPVAWIEARFDTNDLPEILKDAILTTSITLPAIEKTLKYGCLLIMLLSITSILYMVSRKLKEHSKQVANLPQISFVFS